MLNLTAEDSTIRAATLADAEAVAAIYNHYITKTVVDVRGGGDSTIGDRTTDEHDLPLPWRRCAAVPLGSAHGAERAEPPKWTKLDV